MHGWHSLQKSQLNVSDFTKSVHSLTFYDSVLVVEKRPIKEPYHEQTGHASIPGWEPPMTLRQRVMGRIRRVLGK